MSSLIIQQCQILSGLSSVIRHYEAYLIDAWGVLHDGISAYPDVLSCLKQLRKSGRPVLIVSNAARRHTAIIDELAQLAITPDLYQGIVSSGELAWQSINTAIEDKSFYGQVGYYLGPQRSKGIMAGLELDWTESIHQANFILNAGSTERNPQDTRGCETLLMEAVKYNLPMICANPDRVAIRGGEMGLSAGSIAERYSQLGASKIVYHGKPYLPIYQQAISQLGNISRRKILAIGDAFATDIRGGNNAGVDTWLIAAGIHNQALLPLSQLSITTTGAGEPAPTYASDYLAW